MVKISELLKQRMTDLKISADEVANYCGVNRATVYRWLNGEIDNMKRSNIASLAQILRLDPALIVGDIDENTESISHVRNARDIFVTNLKFWMKKRGKEQADIARDLNINISTVSSWCNGIAYPRIDKIQMLADYLNIPMRYLTDETSEETIAIPDHFNSAQEAIGFILRQPLVADYGGYDLSTMSDDDIIAFANEIAGMILYAARQRGFARKEKEGEAA